MTNLCNTLNDLSKDIFDWISAQSAVKEESLTDWFLYELSKRERKVFYRGFTRHEESWYSGADWDWVFVFNDGVVRLRVQAKRLRAKNNQPDILRSKDGVRQIDLLIKSALRKRSYPLYAFYTSDRSATLCQDSVAGPQGAYLSGAFSVLANLASAKAKVLPKDALAISYPLPCIVCCPIAASTGSARSLIGQIHRYFGTPVIDQLGQGENLGYQQDIPPFVKELLDSNGEVSDQWEEKFARELEETSALVVVDARG